MTELARLFRRQWALPLLGAILRKRSLTISRQTSAETLASLARQGLLTRDGSLTAKGRRVAEKGEPLLAALDKLGAQRKWSLPILHALGPRPRRFGELKEALPGATPRALSMALKDLAASALIERRRAGAHFVAEADQAVERRARRAFEAHPDQPVHDQVRVGHRGPHGRRARLKQRQAQRLADRSGSGGLRAHLALPAREHRAAIRAESVQDAQRVQRHAALHAVAAQA